MNNKSYLDKFYYDVLKVSRDALKADILKAYKQSSLVTHPDKGGDVELQQMVNEARDVLTDDDKRISYNSYLDCFKIPDGKGEKTARYFDKISMICGRYRNGNIELKKANSDLQEQLRVEAKKLKEESAKIQKLNSELVSAEDKFQKSEVANKNFCEELKK